MRIIQCDVFALTGPAQDIAEVQLWVTENTATYHFTGDPLSAFGVNDLRVEFGDEKDAVAFKLRWC